MLVVGLLLLGWLLIVMGVPPRFSLASLSYTTAIVWIAFVVALAFAAVATIRVRSLSASTVRAYVSVAAFIFVAALTFGLLSPSFGYFTPNDFHGPTPTPAGS